MAGLFRVAVVTPYHETPLDWLHRCHQSVLAQTHPATHFLVADGAPLEVVDKLEARHIVLTGPHRDFGDTPRAIGAIAAIRGGFDAVAFLDADNWLEPGHVASLVALHRRTGAAVCTARRWLHHLDGTRMGACYQVDGESFVDTNCLLLTRAAFRVVPILYEMKDELHAVGDRVLWHQIQRLGLTTAHAAEPTVCYRTGFLEHYHHFRIKPPPEAKAGRLIGPALKLFGRLVDRSATDQRIAAQPLPEPGPPGMLPQEPEPRYRLISMIGVPEGLLPGLLDMAIAEARRLDRIPVFITDRLDLRPYRDRQMMVEHLPSQASRRRLAPDLDWPMHIARRLAMLQAKWRSGRIIAMGLPVDALVGKKRLDAG
jgi:hypothetical protein